MVAPIGVNLFWVYYGLKHGPKHINDGGMSAGITQPLLDKIMAGTG